MLLELQLPHSCYCPAPGGLEQETACFCFRFLALSIKWPTNCRGEGSDSRSPRRREYHSSQPRRLTDFTLSFGKFLIPPVLISTRAVIVLAVPWTPWDLKVNRSEGRSHQSNKPPHRSQNNAGSRLAAGDPVRRLKGRRSAGDKSVTTVQGTWH